MSQRAPRGRVPTQARDPIDGARRSIRYGRVGDGPPCPVIPDHGPLLWMVNTSRWYCPHSDHAVTKCFWKPEELNKEKN